MQTGVIEAVSDKQVNTRRGPAISYRVKINNTWYGAGFKAPPEKGTTVQFEAQTNSAGYMDAKNIVPIGGASGSVVKTGASSGWPIPKDSGRDRSIMRQNAVTNALRFLELKDRLEHPEEDVHISPAQVIMVARDFEAYYSGDLDVAEAAAFDEVVNGSD